MRREGIQASETAHFRVNSLTGHVRDQVSECSDNGTQHLLGSTQAPAASSLLR